MQARRGPRIAGGRFKGSRLLTAPRLKVRPASARARQVLFDLIGPEVAGAVVLDLFAGLGTVGLEALSRGAHSAVFVEREPELCELLRVNLERVGCLAQSEIVRADAIGALHELEGGARRFTIAFVDPPYGRGEAAEAVCKLAAGSILAPGAIVAAEHGRREQPPTESKLLHLWRRELGYTVLSGYRYDPTPASPSSAAGTITPPLHYSSTPEEVGGGGTKGGHP